MEDAAGLGRGTIGGGHQRYRAGRLQPKMIARAPVADRARLLAGYQDQIKELAATCGDLEAALRAGKNTEATDIVADIRELQKAGHHKYRTKD